MIQSLFPAAPSGGRGGAQAASRTKPYVQFKAGKCRLERRPGEPASYLVTPEPQKGSLALVRGNDQLTHIQWTDRSTGAVVDDLIVFPEEAVLSKVDTGVAKDRVYLLQWRGSERRFMFWMQDKDGAADADNCKKFNDCMRSPPSAEAGAPAGPTDPFLQLLSQSRAAAATGGAPAAAPTSIGGLDFSALLSGLMNQSQPPSQPGGSASSQGTPATPAAALDASGVFSAQDFQNAMMGVNASATASSPAPSSQHHQPSSSQAVGLQDVLRADQVVASGVLSDPDVVRDLLPLLPEGQQTVDHLNETVRSPQFQQSLDELTHAIQSDPTGAVMANLGLPVPPQGVNPFNPVGTFLDAVQAQHPSNSDISSSGSGSASQRGGDGGSHQGQPSQEEDEEGDRMDQS